MIINEVLFGILATLFVEQTIALIVIVIKNRFRSHSAKKVKGGKNNG